jgi:hypothetical protein
MKDAIAQDEQSQLEVFDMKGNDRVHTLFSGTLLIQATREDIHEAEKEEKKVLLLDEKGTPSPKKGGKKGAAAAGKEDASKDVEGKPLP